MEVLLTLDREDIINLLIGDGIIAVFFVLSPLFSYLLIKIFNIKKNIKQIKKHAFYAPFRDFLRIWGVYIAIIYIQPILNISHETMIWIEKIFRIIVILTISIGIAHSITEKSGIIKRLRARTERDVNDTTIIFGVRMVRFVIYVIAGCMIIADLGYDLNGIITGLGLGSVVITLAAQDTIKNLFGGLVIFLDKPFKVGDFIQFNEYQGTVEDIAFRSTRLRTLDNSIAQIPNAEISSTTVVNYSKIQKRRYTLDLGIVLNTDLKEIMKLERKIERYLKTNEHVIEGSSNVCFKDLRSSDYNIFIYCYLNIVDYTEFLKQKEIINYDIMNIIHECNIELAYDTKTIELKKA